MQLVAALQHQHHRIGGMLLAGLHAHRFVPFGVEGFTDRVEHHQTMPLQTLQKLLLDQAQPFVQALLVGSGIFQCLIERIENRHQVFHQRLVDEAPRLVQLPIGALLEIVHLRAGSEQRIAQAADLFGGADLALRQTL